MSEWTDLIHEWIEEFGDNDPVRYSLDRSGDLYVWHEGDLAVRELIEVVESLDAMADEDVAAALAAVRAFYSDKP